MKRKAIPTARHGYRQFVAIYRCDVVTSQPFLCVCGDVKVELFREDRTYAASEYHNLVVAAVTGAEYCSPVHPPVKLDTRSLHLMLTTRTRLERSDAQAGCEAAIDRVVATIAAVSSPELFRTLLFRGWLQGPPGHELGPLLKVVDPIDISGKQLASDFSIAASALGRNSALRDRFALMSRFVTKGLSEASEEEAFVWLWTALEVFPMVDTTDIRPISEFLAAYVGQPPQAWSRLAFRYAIEAGSRRSPPPRHRCQVLGAGQARAACPGCRPSRGLPAL